MSLRIGTGGVEPARLTAVSVPETVNEPWNRLRPPSATSMNGDTHAFAVHHWLRSLPVFSFSISPRSSCSTRADSPRVSPYSSRSLVSISASNGSKPTACTP